MTKEPNLHFEESYFEAEEKCGFMVDEVMKRAWAAELEVWYEFDRICKTYDLKYFAMAGTLLGAVRHKGFIPWDDDMDFGMLRSDYNKFLAVAEDELPEGFRVMYREENRSEVFACLVNSRSVSTEPEKLKRFHGCPYMMGLDIFPIDYLPRDETEQKLLKSLLKIIYSVIDKKDNWEKNLDTLEELMKVKFVRDKTLRIQLVDYFVRICSMYTEEEADEMASYAFWCVDQSSPYQKDWFDEIIELPFENVMMPVPKTYDEILKGKYGDYMTPVQGKASHGYPFFKKQHRLFRKYLEAQGVNPNSNNYKGILLELSEEELVEQDKNDTVVSSSRDFCVVSSTNMQKSDEMLMKQMCQELKSNGWNAMMYKEGCEQEDSVVIIPGQEIELLWKLKECYKVLWLIDVDEFIAYADENRMPAIKEEISLYLVQSYRGYEHLTEAVGISSERILYVPDYIGEAYGQFLMPAEFRKPVALYNPDSENEELLPLIENVDGLEWIPLTGQSQEDKLVLMQEAKVFVDFGKHTRRDLVTREAARCGCCIVTNRKGCAACYEDYSFKDLYKFENVREQYVEIAELLYDICENYESHTRDFGEYRFNISMEKDKFSKAVRKMVKNIEAE